MSRKRLPKAITRSIAERDEADADTVAHVKRGRGTPERRDSSPAHEQEAAAREPVASDQTRAATARATAPQPLTGEVLPPETSGTKPPTGQRRTAARRVVERYKYYAALGGLFPMPVVSVAGLTAINVRMVKALSDIYNVPFESNQTRSIIIGLIGGSVPTGLGLATASTVAMLVPAGAFVGLAVSAATAAAMTRGIGLVFIEHFESGAALPRAANRAA